ncbi:MAG: RelA/SpoT domain-containing protein [Verrucomicrobia bacterium]|nr:RelA/SpoT domain-containing protein [Verrucomicrobiota bacterium]
MTEPELRQAFEDEKPSLHAWGTAVREGLVSAIQQVIGGRKLAEFLKIPPEPRVKDTESFLAKALRRGKNYQRPLEQITDKVGVRFVVLLRSELKIIEKAIEDCASWDWQKDKDFEAERAERPHHFDYQSVHYVVRTKGPVACGSVTVPPGTSCEVQVRTLLQHAYAELAHDRIYKPTGTIDKEAVRQVAKSAALVETTDEIFVAVNERLQAANAEIQRVHDLLASVYSALLGEPGSTDFRLSNALLDPYRGQLLLITQGSLDAFLTEYDFLADKIKERAPLSALYRHPVVIAVYFLVQAEPDLVPKYWPFDMKHLEMIYADLGLSTEDRLW